MSIKVLGPKLIFQKFLMFAFSYSANVEKFDFSLHLILYPFIFAFLEAFCIYLFLMFCFYFWERACTCMHASGGREEGGQRICADSREHFAGLRLMNPEIMACQLIEPPRCPLNLSLVLETWTAIRVWNLFFFFF